MVGAGGRARTEEQGAGCSVTVDVIHRVLGLGWGISAENNIMMFTESVEILRSWGLSCEGALRASVSL